MRDLRRKFAVAALTAGVVVGGLAVPTTAGADSVKAVQITVCNDASVEQLFWVKGYNQHGDWDDSPIWKVNGGTCATGWDYWWQQDRSVELHYKRGNAGWTWKQAYVPRTKDRTTTLRLS
ncbi:hypothetical protein [Streptomyces sp. NPDC047043]|uniref:hypothetical protein n=1 Tax=Streptomyces sp. NPDC047043 TaxID=3154497 RepID=UPI0033F4CC91